MGFFNFSKKSVVGIDIGTASIKAIELSKESGRFKLLNYGIFELKSGAQALNIGAKSENDKTRRLSDEDIVWGIKEILKRSEISGRDAVVSIPSFPTFATTINMPYASEEDVANSIEFEARKYIPVPLSDVQLDWSIIKSNDSSKTVSSGDSSKPSVEVLLIAVPKDDIVRYKKIIKDAGMSLKALELESFAMTRALIGNDLSPYCIVSIGGRSTSILIVDNGYQRISHDYEVGGFEITKIIAQSLNIGLERAEELQKSFGIKNQEDNVIKEAMSSLLDTMVFETKKTIYSYEDIKNIKIKNVMLVGGLANMPNFANYFSEKLGREVVLGNPTARILLPDGIQSKIGELNATFAVALGLAMREI